MRDLSQLWPLAPAHADDDYDARQHTFAADPGTAACGCCGGTGSITIAPPDQADNCPTCGGSGEIEAEREPTRH